LEKGKMKTGKKLTVNYFRKKKQEKEVIICLTAYDAPTAALAEESGVELILVGDSMGNTILGYENTIPVTLEQSLHHCAAVCRATKNSFVVGDMPFMTHHISIGDSLRNAARYLQEAGADAVKIECGQETIPLINRLVSAGVPVMGHIGLLPQKVLTAGGYRIAGKTEAEADRLMADAVALEDAGIFSLVLEGVPAEVSARITESLRIPTIGIGAGIGCDGQIQVVTDILGLSRGFIPKHARRYANLHSEIKKAFKAYVKDVSGRTFPGKENSF
jgi:3-methyl-2-oxobutanoate hydroxymethyltransferase